MTTVSKRLVGLGVLLVAGGLGAYLASWQTKKSDRDAKAKEASAKVLTLSEPEKVRELSLTTPAGTFVIVREGGTQGETRWQITKPQATLAEASTVDAMLAHLASLKHTSEVGGDEGKANLALFGLDKPRFVVTLTDASGNSETLRIGKRNSFDGSIYVQKQGNNAVELVPSSLEYQVDKDLFRLRDKKLAHFTTTDVTKLAVTHKDGAYRIEKQGDDFYLREPKEALADATQVMGILSSLATTQAKAFVSEAANAAQLKQYGLAQPTATVEVVAGAPHKLLFGSAGDSTYVSAGEGAPILELPNDATLRKLQVTYAQLRDKRVVVFDRDAVAKMQVTKGDKSITFARGKDDKGGDNWRITSPEDANAQNATLSGLLYRLWNLKAKEILVEAATAADWANSGLNSPAATIEIFKADGSSIAKVSFGKLEGERQHVGTGEGKRIDGLDKSFVDELSVNLDDYRETSPQAKK